MRELSYFRPSYVHGDVESRDAHRLVRNAIAIGLAVPSVPSGPVIDAMSVVERIEGLADDTRVISPADAGTLAVALEAVAAALDAGLDEDWRPRGAIGAEIADEASRPPDDDRVFERQPDGRIGLVYPRISLSELTDRLPEVAGFLRAVEASGRGASVEE